MSRRGVKPSGKEKKRPEYRIVSIELLNNIDVLIQEFIKRMMKEFPEVFVWRTSGYTWCYKDTSMTSDSLFTVLLTMKRGLQVRVGVDPDKFRDERKITKTYKGRFFKKKEEERGFTIDRPEQLDYAMELIKQCY